MLEGKKLKGMLMSYVVIRDTLGYFRWHNQINRIDKMLSLMQHLDAEEAELFFLDLREISNELHA